VASILGSDYLEYLLTCPSCGNRMRVDAQYLRQDRFGGKFLERVLKCPTCNMRIRQNLNLTLIGFDEAK